MPPAFSRIVTDHWLSGDHGPLAAEDYAVIVDERLRKDLSLTMLAVHGGPRVVTVAPDAAIAVSLTGGDTIGDVHLRERIARAGREFNGADRLFYLPLSAQHELLSSPTRQDARRLTRADAAEFERFCAIAPADDLDDAFVDIDHWLAYGAFTDGRLAAVASAYPWQETRLADIGVITLPAFRGRGLATQVVRAIAGDALRQGYEPQYRCQLDNLASTALAHAAGFAPFGEWDVITAG